MWRHSFTSSACKAKLKLQTKRHSRQRIGTKHNLCVTFVLKALISNPAGEFMSLIWYHPCDCSYLSAEGVTMLNRFPAIRWPRRHVQWELCGTNFRENIANLRVSYYNGKNNRSARVLFVQHPREQGEWWLRQNPRYARPLSPKYGALSQGLLSDYLAMSRSQKIYSSKICFWLSISLIICGYHLYHEILIFNYLLS